MARREAEKLAQRLAALPQGCLRSDRRAVYEGCELPLERALALEFELGLQVVQSGESLRGARAFRRRKPAPPST
jgi:enoyl-CoA hydratase